MLDPNSGVSTLSDETDENRMIDVTTVASDGEFFMYTFLKNDDTC